MPLKDITARNAYARAWYAANKHKKSPTAKARSAAVRREYERLNRDRARAREQTYAAARRAAYHANMQNPVFREAQRAKGRKQRSTEVHRLTDTYIKQVLVTNTELTFKDIPLELIEAKRLQLQLLRAAKQQGA